MADAVAAPSLVATVVAVCLPPEREETAAVLQALGARAAVRTLLVTFGDERQPEVRRTGHATAIERLVPQYLNNAVASLRLSSLPTIAWWRGGPGAPVEALAELATLVDRLVLDSPDPTSDWREALKLADRTAFSDIRWARLTRWRNLMAQFFDIPEVREDAAAFRRLEVAGEDRHTCRLFAGWLAARLPHGDSLSVRMLDGAGGHPISAVSFASPARTLRLRLLPAHACLETRIEDAGQPAISRVVSPGDQSHASLLAAELRVRSRDEAFEQALREVRP
ncbi:MAG TPA: OpcA/G6PD domain-containing protein [Vicinamibacterales bacterium]|nr:OpcA/G6PD domain-containing protein [Vicinamibacterales bacterium]